MFVDGQPTDSENYHLKYQVAMGVSPQSYASTRGGQRSKGMVRSYQHRRKLVRTSTVASIILKHYSIGSQNPRLHVTLHDVEALLARSSHFTTDGIFSAPGKDGSPPRIFNNKAKKPTVNRLTPTELLSALSSNPYAEHTSMNFNYITMSVHCMQILREFHDASFHLLVEKFP